MTFLSSKNNCSTSTNGMLTELPGARRRSPRLMTAIKDHSSTPVSVIGHDHPYYHHTLAKTTLRQTNKPKVARQLFTTVGEQQKRSSSVLFSEGISSSSLSSSSTEDVSSSSDPAPVLSSLMKCNIDVTNNNVDEANELVERRRIKRIRRNNELSGRREATIKKEELDDSAIVSSVILEDVLMTPPSRKAIKRRVSSSSSNKSIKTKKPVLYSNAIAKINPHNKWIDLNVSPTELRASANLTTGQSFVWQVVVQAPNSNDHDEITKEESNDIMIEEGSSTSSSSSNSSKGTSQPSAWGTHDATEWIGVIGQRVVSIKETSTTTMVRIVFDREQVCDDNDTTISSDYIETIKKEFRSYFQLDVPLKPLYEEWIEADGENGRLPRIAQAIPGARVLRQDPVECLFSFLCSSNNNIPRITLILSRLRAAYGTKLLEINLCNENDDGEGFDEAASGDNDILSFYSFPTLEDLKCATEQELRDLGLGYRAKYMIQTRDLLLEKGGLPYLMTLRNEPDPNVVQEALIEFSGIGRKVADCVALFSLDQTEAIPVDVHVMHIACRDYDAHNIVVGKSMTPTIYKGIGDLFRHRFPNYAGWAHSLLFVAELPSFRPVLPPDMVAQMDKWREEEKARKKKK